MFAILFSDKKYKPNATKRNVKKITMARPPNGAALPRNKVKFLAKYRAIFIDIFASTTVTVSTKNI